MIEFDNNLYPLNNIKYIGIDRDKFTLTIYFIDGIKLFPKSLQFENLKDLEKKVEDIGGNKKRNLFG